MNSFSSLSMFNIILIIIGIYLPLKNIHTTSHSGKSIIKVNDNKELTIFFIVMLIFWCMLLAANIRLYIRSHNQNGINIIASNLFCMEVVILSLIRSLKSSQIRENGIYKSGYFYRWSKILSYSWISPDTIGFKVKTYFKSTRNFEITIKKDLKSKVDEIIQRKLIL